jgi:signal transduction histidine kinase
MLNAAEAMPRGGTLTVKSREVFLPRSATKPTYVAVEFGDTGQGMNEEQRRRAFRSVLQTTKAKGTGLGLAIVARVIETHHGKIKIRSRVGEGTTVSIMLPV